MRSRRFEVVDGLYKEPDLWILDLELVTYLISSCLIATGSLFAQESVNASQSRNTHLIAYFDFVSVKMTVSMGNT